MARVGVLCWQAAYRGILPAEFLAGLSVEPRAVAWETLLESEGSKDAPTWVAERDGRVTGYLSSGPARDDDTPLHTAEIYAVYVLPGKWRKGAGRALLDAAVEYWLEHGAAGLVLWTFEANASAHAFYAALSWRPDGARREIDLGGFSVPELRYRLAPEGARPA
jgi:GNAT superfamily N-acetyltransferase